MRDATARQLRQDEYRQTALREARGLMGDEASTERGSRRRLHLVEPDDAPVTSTDFEPTYAENGRRTVTITGHPVPARPRRSTAATQIQARPDRIALWAVLLGLFLVFMAVATASAATL